MKKIIIPLFTILVFTSAQAQQKPLNNKQPVTSNQQQELFGLFAGPNLNYLDYYDKATTIEGTNTSFHAGLLFQRNINKCFALQPALLFSIRGGKIRDIDSTMNIKLMNIELPINFLYRYKQLMIGAGPNFSYGINGKIEDHGNNRDVYDASESFERTLKRFEFGGNFMIYYNFKKDLLATINFSPGFTNIYQGDGSAPRNLKAKTRMFGISIGYILATKNE
jgi:Outer membrane protein beta-barrel domain